MKRIISLLLVTLVCAAVFAGCGSGGASSSATSGVSSQPVVISNYLPHNEKVTWDSDRGAIAVKDDVKFSKDLSYATSTTAKPTIGSTTFDYVYYQFYDNGNIEHVSYAKKGSSTDYQLLKNTLNDLYGKSYESDEISTWDVKLPNGEKCSIILSNQNESDKNISLMYFL